MTCESHARSLFPTFEKCATRFFSLSVGRSLLLERKTMSDCMIFLMLADRNRDDFFGLTSSLLAKL